MIARPIEAGDTRRVGATLARALHDDPGWVHVFPDAARRSARMETLMRIVSDAVYLRGRASWVIDDGAGAALWDAPGHHGIGALTALWLVPRLSWIMGRRAPTALGMFRQMERRHPGEPHYYLSVLGIDPAEQGRGLGPRLLAPMLEKCDDTRTLAWLESTNPKNHSFYQRLGFELADEHQVEGGPTITFFGRRAR